jgi:hypothetical protein
MKRYVVQVYEAEPGDPKQIQKWLVAISYQSYANRPGYRELSTDRSEAFVFTERAAAEFAAVFVCGKVEVTE